MTETDPLIPLRRGLLEFAVLRLLSTGRLYAADVLDRLSSTEFATKEGTLYPLFGKLRRDGLVEHEWEESEAGPPRKYYRLTQHGKDRHARMGEYWTTLNKTLDELGAES